MIRVTLFLPWLLLLANLAGCAVEDDASRLNRALQELQTAIEERDAGAVIDHLTDDFQAQADIDARKLRAMMFYYFRQYRQITVFATGQRIRLDGEQADVTVNALLLGGEQLIPERGKRYQVEMRWLKQRGDWKLSRLRWQASTDASQN